MDEFANLVPASGPTQNGLAAAKTVPFPEQPSSTTHRSRQLELSKNILDRVGVYRLDDGVTWFVCPHCPFQTIDERIMLKDHISHHVKKGKHHCPSCSFSSNSAQQVVTHELDVHEPDQQRTTEEKFQCRHCPFRTRFAMEISAHTLFHVDSNRFHCSLCSFCANDQLTVVEHEAIHFAQCPRILDGIARVTRKYQRADDKTPFFIPGDMVVPDPVQDYPSLTEDEKAALKARLEGIIDVDMFF